MLNGTPQNKVPLVIRELGGPEGIAAKSREATGAISTVKTAIDEELSQIDLEGLDNPSRELEASKNKLSVFRFASFAVGMVGALALGMLERGTAAFWSVTTLSLGAIGCAIWTYIKAEKLDDIQRDWE